MGPIVCPETPATDYQSTLRNIPEEPEITYSKVAFIEIKSVTERKLAKMQWIQDPRQSNVDIPNNVRGEISRHFRDKKRHN